MNHIKKIPSFCFSVIKKVQIRNYAVRKRFYKNTGILFNDGKYEITLDHRKLKTPKGNPFFIESEPLALAVAAEWDAQKEKIQQSSMHLTALCSTVLDNPNNLTKYDIVQYIINYLPTDTILFHTDSNESEDLCNLQVKEWDPMIDWFNKRFGVEVSKSRDISGPVINESIKSIIGSHLLSYNFAAVNGYMFAIDTIKSLILTLACVDRLITPEHAVLLSRLEEEFQMGYWGRVEWAHDLNQMELQARLAAAILFIHFNSSSTFVQTKKSVHM